MTQELEDCSEDCEPTRWGYHTITLAAEAHFFLHCGFATIILTYFLVLVNFW